MALGAQPGSVIWLVMREVLVPLAIGLAAGVPAAICLGRLVAAQLHGSKPASVDRGRLRGAADPCGKRAGLDPGAARRPHRSDFGVAVRVARLLCRTRLFKSGQILPQRRVQPLV